MEPTASKSTYDELAYESKCYRPSHPDNLSVVGRLAGFSSVAVTKCRVLEIGCGTGLNLIPMAVMLPESDFVGIDLSAKQVAQARDVVEKLGLKNIQISQRDILDFQPDTVFDYVIAHGIYSWVPSEIREKLMGLFRRCLSPNGLGYISFNTWPGSYVRQMARDMMLFHSRSASSMRESVAKARAIVSLASTAISGLDTPYHKAIRAEAPQILLKPDCFLAHDELEATWQPVYLKQFLNHAHQYDLTCLGAAEPAMNLARTIPQELRQQLQRYSQNSSDLEQYCDFIYGTQYRSAVLTLRTSVQAANRGGADAVREMFFAGQLVERPEGPVTSADGEIRFVHEKTNAYVVSSEPAIKAVLRHLSTNWPKAVGFQQLHVIASANSAGHSVSEDLLAQNLFAAYCTSVIELWTRPTNFLATNPQRPLLTNLARLQAATGRPIGTLRHEEFNPPAGFIQNPQMVRRLLSLMDGTRDRKAIVDEMSACVARNEFSFNPMASAAYSPHGMGQFVDQFLSMLEASSMLSAGEQSI